MNNIALEDVAAFGDTTNDNDMIAISGTGVCMCNEVMIQKQLQILLQKKVMMKMVWLIL